MIANIGEVKRYIKPKADSTLRNMKKDNLIEYIRTLEHNYNVAVSFNENQAKYVESLGVLPKWIPVSERLPDKSDYYLYRANNPYRGLKNGVGVSYFRHKAKKWNATNGDFVTHWMPLPEPPKEV